MLTNLENECIIKLINRKENFTIPRRACCNNVTEFQAFDKISKKNVLLFLIKTVIQSDKLVD